MHFQNFQFYRLFPVYITGIFRYSLHYDIPILNIYVQL